MPRTIDWTQKVKAPAPGSVNTKWLRATPSMMARVLGDPRKTLGAECLRPTGRRLTAHLESRNVGFPSGQKARGLRPALHSLERVLARIRQEEPSLWELLGHDGMLCCRLSRGSMSPSMHSWGIAIDVTLDGAMDTMEDGKALAGTLRLREFFQEEGWLWGGQFGRRDGMHFECSWNLVSGWARRGFLN